MLRNTLFRLMLVVLMFLSVGGAAVADGVAVGRGDVDSRPLTEPGWMVTYLSWGLTYIVFPGAVLVIIYSLASACMTIIGNGSTSVGRLRRTVGTALPIVLLSAAVAMRFDAQQLLTFVEGLPLLTRCLYGAGVCIVLLEIGKQLSRVDSDAVMALYAMLISSIAAFLVWAFTVQFLRSLGPELMGFIVGGAFHIIFRGIPVRSEETPQRR